MLTGTGFALSEIDRRLMQVIRLGRVVEVDAEKARVRVQVGENTTGERPWVTCAGAIKIWNPPAVGEQVVLLSPGETSTKALFCHRFITGRLQRHPKIRTLFRFSCLKRQRLFGTRPLIRFLSICLLKDISNSNPVIYRRILIREKSRF